MNNEYRNHTCGELNIKNVGEEVRLAGWVQRIRNLGSMKFVDLRDEEGMNAIFEKYGGMTLDSGEVIQYADFSEYEEQLNQRVYSEAVNTGRFKFGKKLFGVGMFVLGIGIVGLIVLLISLCKAEGLFTAIFIGFVLLALLVGVVNFFLNASSSMEEKARQKTFERILEEELAVANEYNEKMIDKLWDEYNEIIVPTYSDAYDLLQHLLDKNILHPKYRDFVAVAQIYEYIDTGRCTELEGTNGAYNLYESELRQNTIIDRLDVIVDQLAQLNRTMRYVANSVNQTNMLLDNISASLDRIETNTALTAYNTQVTAYYTELASKYNYKC